MNIKCVLHVFFKLLYKSDLISTKNACEGGERRLILTGHVIYNLGNLVFYHSSCSDKICTYMLNKLVTIEEMSLKNATALSFPANSYKYYLSLSLSLPVYLFLSMVYSNVYFDNNIASLWIASMFKIIITFVKYLYCGCICPSQISTETYLSSSKFLLWSAYKYICGNL